MPSNPSMRASDADRERTATLLREHHAEGRLTGEEFHERLDAAYAAKTLGDLDALLADLPAIDLYRLPAAGLRYLAALVVSRLALNGLARLVNAYRAAQGPPVPPASAEPAPAGQAAPGGSEAAPKRRRNDAAVDGGADPATLAA